MKNGHLAISDATFDSCAAEYGGSVYLDKCSRFEVLRTVFLNSSANRFGVGFMTAKGNSVIETTNVTGSKASYIGGLRIDFVPIRIRDCSFSRCESELYGALWDWSHFKDPIAVELSRFTNNTSNTWGSCFTGFHWEHNSVFKRCEFVMSFHSVLVYSMDATCVFDECVFAGQRSDEIFVRFDSSVVECRNTTFTKNSFR